MGRLVQGAPFQRNMEPFDKHLIRQKNKHFVNGVCSLQWDNMKVHSEPDHPRHTCYRPKGHNARKHAHRCACGATKKEK